MANDQGLRLPAELALPLVTAPEPYAGADRGARPRRSAPSSPRQNMKDKSGASVMDAKTQVTSVHGHSVLDLALLPLEATSRCRWCTRSPATNDRALLDVAVAAEVNLSATRSWSRPTRRATPATRRTR